MAPVVVLAIPLAALAALISSVFGLKAELSAAEVASYLRDFIENRSRSWDWDDFTSIPISDPQLERIRLRAAAVNSPATDEGLAVLRALLAEAEDLAKLHTAS